MCLVELIKGFIIGLILVFIPNPQALVLWIGIAFVGTIVMDGLKAMDNKNYRRGCMAIIISVLLATIFYVVMARVPTSW